MKYLKYIFRNVTRNKLRTILAVLSISVCMMIITVVYGYLVQQGEWARTARQHSRLVVMSVEGFAGALPIASVDAVRKMDTITAATPYSWFGGLYSDETTPFAQFGTDPEQVFKVFEEYVVAPEELKAWQEDRTGCVVERELAASRGWKVGDRLLIKGDIYPVDLDLTVRGIFETTEGNQSLWFHWQYLEEMLKARESPGSGSAGVIYAKTRTGDQVASTCSAIDAKYSSSRNPTWSQSEEAFAQMFTAMLGNVQMFIRVICLAVAFSLVLVTANSMAMGVRERTTEIAVLKAIGFGRAKVLALILGEALVISLLGGVFGVGLGQLLMSMIHKAMPQLVPLGHVIWWYVFAAVGFALALGVLSGAVPAFLAARRSVVDGLRRVA